MSDRARGYVSQLGPREVTAREKLVLMAIAEEFKERYGTANVPSDEICDYAMITKRHFRRIMDSLRAKGLVKYRPGVGKGVYSSFELPGLSPTPQAGEVIKTEKGTKRGHKEDIKRTFSTPTIRKENLNLNLDQNQNQHASGALKHALDALTQVKAKLEAELPGVEYAFWVRPIYLMGVAGNCLKLTVPPNRQIAEKARGSARIQDLIRNEGYSGAVFSFYPSDYELERLRQEAPEIFAKIMPVLKKRVALGDESLEAA